MGPRGRALRDERARRVRCRRRHRPPGLASIAMEQRACRGLSCFRDRVQDGGGPLSARSNVFSIPEAACGRAHGRGSARRPGLDCETGRSSFGTNAEGADLGLPDGLVKLVFRVPDKTLVGGTSWASRERAAYGSSARCRRAATNTGRPVSSAATSEVPPCEHQYARTGCGLDGEGQTGRSDRSSDHAHATLRRRSRMRPSAGEGPTTPSPPAR